MTYLAFSILNESSTVGAKAIATQSVGTIYHWNKVFGTIKVTAIVEFTGAISNGNELIFNGVIYTFKNTPVNPRDVNIYSGGGSFCFTALQLSGMALTAVVNGNSSFVGNGHTFVAGIPSTPDANVIAGPYGGIHANGYVLLTAIPIGAAGNSIVSSGTGSLVVISNTER